MEFATIDASAPKRVRPEARRIGAGVAVAIVHGLIGFALLSGMTVPVPRTREATLRLFDVLPVPPPPETRVPPPRVRPARHRDRAAPPNLMAKATPVVAPVPVVLTPAAPPIIAAAVPGVGVQAAAGASHVAGPGSGSGGRGTGTGGGGSGDGDGGTPLRWRSGSIRDSDYPRGALAAGISGTVRLSFVVGIDGRVTDCTVTGSSGNAELDETTCRLIRKRFRYKPSTDRSGRPIPDVVTGDHVWTVYGSDDPGAQGR